MCLRITPLKGKEINSHQYLAKVSSGERVVQQVIKYPGGQIKSSGKSCRGGQNAVGIWQNCSEMIKVRGFNKFLTAFVIHALILFCIYTGHLTCAY